MAERPQFGNQAQFDVLDSAVASPSTSWSGPPTPACHDQQSSTRGRADSPLQRYHELINAGAAVSGHGATADHGNVAEI
jgi:hypothetical protein